MFFIYRFSIVIWLYNVNDWLLIIQLYERAWTYVILNSLRTCKTIPVNQKQRGKS